MTNNIHAKMDKKYHSLYKHNKYCKTIGLYPLTQLDKLFVSEIVKTV